MADYCFASDNRSLAMCLPSIQKSPVQIFIQMVENILTNVENIPFLTIHLVQDCSPLSDYVQDI